MHTKDSGASPAALHPTVERELWQAMERLRAYGITVQQVRSLVLGMIYMQKGRRDLLELSRTDLNAITSFFKHNNSPFLRTFEHNLPAGHTLNTHDKHPLRELIDATISITQSYGTAQAFSSVIESFGHRDRRYGDLCTPSSLTSLLSSILEIDSATTVYDPFCRSGELLAAAADHISYARREARPIFYAHTPMYSQASVTEMNLGLRDFEHKVEMVNLDTLLRPHSQVSGMSRVLTNPPFNLKHATDRHSDSLWRYGEPPKNNSNYAWLQYVVDVLAPNGRAAVIMANGSLSSNRERDIRRRMLEDGCVESIISLPSRLFPATGIPVSVWLLRPPGSGATELLLIDASRMGRLVSRTLRVLDQPDVVDIATLINHWRSGHLSEPPTPLTVTAVPLSEVRKNEYDLIPKKYQDAFPRSVNIEQEFQIITPIAHDLTSAQHRAESAISTIEQILDRMHTLTVAPPIDWQNVQLGQISTVTPGAPTADDPDGPIPVVKPKNLISGRIAGSTDFVSAKEAERRRNYRILPGDLLISRTGTIGKVALVMPGQEGWLFSTGIIRIRPSESVDPRYLSLLLVHPDSQNWMARNAKGTAIQSINAHTLHGLPVRLPPQREQNALSEAVESLDNIVAAYEQAHALAVDLRNAALSMLFSDRTP